MYGSVAFGLDIGIEKNKKLCDRGNAINCFNVGFLLEYSGGSAEYQSKKYYKKACILGIAEGCNALGDEYYGMDKSATYYSKACDLGYAISCESLAYLYVDGGFGGFTIKDIGKYIGYLDKACVLGQASSCSELSDYYSGISLRRPSLILDKQKAREYYQKACLFDKTYCN